MQSKQTTSSSDGYYGVYKTTHRSLPHTTTSPVVHKNVFSQAYYSPYYSYGYYGYPSYYSYYGYPSYYGGYYGYYGKREAGFGPYYSPYYSYGYYG
ncbi:hypothetical protein ANCDUO_10242 [Ancylostoma duodenale]|uniref:Uncharacterized protein n=1 Tax=Ancylostoma duodenale TaxID=51022 RepID=A0A0C2GEB1_9BILA|nr:hypothetical protein ANCDUO_10242 [Ancylostoma duodenale]